MASVQSAQLAELRRAVEELRAPPPAPAPAAPAVATRDPRAEIPELRARIAALEAELAAAAAPATAGASAAPVDAAEEAAFREAAEKMAEARERAHAIRCVNNLKQLGLAARIWATDNGEDMAPSTWQQMTNEMATPKILVCPADTTRSAAADWAGLGPANVSYDFVTPGAPENEPQVVLFRCPVHGHVCLADGSVQHAVAKTHPEWFRMINGRLWMTGEEPAVSAPDGSRQRASAGMSPELLRRYGLLPAEGSVATNVQPYVTVQPDEDAATAYTMSEELMRRYGLTPSTNANVVIGAGEIPGAGTFEVILEAAEPAPEAEALPEQP
jgi:hypothetical protein